MITGSPEDFFIQGWAGSGSRLPFLPPWVINVLELLPEGHLAAQGPCSLVAGSGAWWVELGIVRAGLGSAAFSVGTPCILSLSRVLGPQLGPHCPETLSAPDLRQRDRAGRGPGRCPSSEVPGVQLSCSHWGPRGSRPSSWVVGAAPVAT